MDISKYFRESLGLRDNESQLLRKINNYFNVFPWTSVFQLLEVHFVKEVTKCIEILRKGYKHEAQPSREAERISIEIHLCQRSVTKASLSCHLILHAYLRWLDNTQRQGSSFRLENICLLSQRGLLWRKEVFLFFFLLLFFSNLV